MEWMSLSTLREKYLSFFESKGHLRLESFSLVPNNDPSLLLINSGMAPMKKYFTGEVTPPRKRVTTCQKCIRTPDIERVGKTARHGTFFEMLGNFSFGDYFKSEATAWAWEFCTKVLKMPADRIWISIYENDDEAFRIWTEQVGVEADHIVRLGKEDNFWEHGSGPCGPCSELYFDRGPEYGCGSPSCGVGCDCDRYVEFWNLVFTQFDSDGKGNYTPLDHPNIDTGMGLERLACISQGVDNLFEVDSVQNIMKHLSRICGVDYKTDAQKDVSFRVITDHIRSTTFMLGDGIMPSNEGRGYVLRRLLRRAARHGRLLGIDRPFLAELSETVIQENCQAYPELAEKRAVIQKVIGVEEAAFGRTIDQGLNLLNELMKQGGQLSGDDAFKLYDTYGFPLDLTKDILEENGMTVDEDTFRERMQEQRDRARNARKASDAEAWKGEGNLLEGVAATNFCGYTKDSAEAKIVALLRDGQAADAVSEGEEAILALDTTPFYAESGGQVGDTGLIATATGKFRVTNTTKTAGGVFLHAGRVESGMLAVGDAVSAEIDAARRMAIRRNHTAAHLLQAGLRQVLGTHVEQAGQLVNESAVRFDFTHFSALTKEELQAVEDWVNRAILEAIPVQNTEMPIAEAKKMGAMALFGEKYGDEVRVVAAGDRSIELCGGTHVENTARIGLFRILSESSVAAGVRRIEAVTGENVLHLLSHYKALLDEAASALKTGNAEDLASKAHQLTAELKEKDKQIETLMGRLAAGRMQELIGMAKPAGNFRVLGALLENTGADALRAMADRFKSEQPDMVVLLGGVAGGKVTFCAACGSEAVKAGAHAGNLVREVAKRAGGNGGGRPDSAMAGGKDAARAAEAVKAAYEIAKAQLGV